ncbi:hypothetical protein FDI40_gp251 [Agrobacterium phage Atu_ph07]|uniref:Uncharacterized protein n=1 Tax=Agrobacterium phage Atu_ph07 TaxID=2024264 RepID=A0A2L0UZS7_9CAUD|nr:hypothetical protein FDI40_gp251 [Agrobacterium phage Atu_ph07]AUZ95031.1 hypothetical protein [Agrobacterium phage Atu_ph07]
MTTETNSDIAQITLTDLTSIVVIIDTAAQRGAFKGEELSSVGSIRDKFASFVKAAQDATAATENASAEETPSN